VTILRPRPVRRLIAALILIPCLGWLHESRAQSHVVTQASTSSVERAADAAPGSAASQAATGQGAGHAEGVRHRLRVQLHWQHQAQFAGFYVAQVRRHFEREGLVVDLIEGGPGIDPFDRLKKGDVDVAVGWLGNALMHSREGPRISHIAQIFARPGLGVACNTRSGVIRPSDLAGRSIGVWNLGDQHVVRALLKVYGVDPSRVQLLAQAPGAADLINGRFACVSAMSYNEWPRLQASSINPEDLRWIDLQAKGLEHVEDGLYVLSDRLASVEFRHQLASLVRALAKGWDDARSARALALDWLVEKNPSLDRKRQQEMLAGVIELLPNDLSRFGLLDLQRFDRQWAQLVSSEGALPARASQLWTFKVMEDVQRSQGRLRTLSAPTRHALDQVIDSKPFLVVIFAAILVFGCAGALTGLQRGFGLWGCLVLALITPLGGAMLRDAIIGGERLPISFIVDPTLPIAIALCTVIIILISRRIAPDTLARWLTPAEQVLGLAGLSIAAAYGACVALSSSLHWFWAPILAAVSISGGGILRDILLGQAAQSLRGALALEEIAIVVSLVLVAGLLLANQFEHQVWMVYASVAAGIGAGAWVQYRVFMRLKA
jgi:NitT/TauT family transport system substrate-binding protein